MKIVRLAGGLVLLAALFYFRLIDLAALRKAAAHPAMLALATAACVLVVPLSGLRWHLLLRSQSLALHPAQTIRIVAVALFFATFLPGGTGSDVVRGVYIYRAAQGRRTSALLSIFIDRLIGFAAFLLVGVAVTLVRPWRSYDILEYGIFAFAALFIGTIVVLFRFGRRIAQAINVLLHGRWHRVAHIVEEAGQALHQYSRAWRSVVLCLGLSITTVGLLAAIIVIIATAMQLGGLSKVEYGIAGLYGMIANTLPITPGGLGVGEAAFASACVALEPVVSGAAYGTIFLVFRCILVISTLPGLLVYLFYPDRTTLLVPVDLKT